MKFLPLVLIIIIPLNFNRRYLMVKCDAKQQQPSFPFFMTAIVVGILERTPYVDTFSRAINFSYVLLFDKLALRRMSSRVESPGVSINNLSMSTFACNDLYLKL